MARRGAFFRGFDADLCVVGAGSGGLSVAAGAAQMGARTILIERDRMGGDCLNVGCVPSKALLAAARAADAVRGAGRFGVRAGEPDVDFAAVHRHVADVIRSIAPHDSAERFEGLGVEVIRAHGRFVGPDRVEADGRTIRARRFVIATGSRPAVPPVPGLGEVPYLTNETLFGLAARPGHLIVVGGGAIGLEMAQAYRLLGAEVTVLEKARILPNDDPELVEVVRARLRRDGLSLMEGAEVLRVERTPPDGVAAIVAADGAERRIEGTHLLVAVGRVPVVEGLGLDAAGVRHGPRGIETDSRMRTTNRRIFAVGDVTGGPQFTHAASYQAGIVLRNALFRLPARADFSALPWVTYTRPELAQVGLTEEAARARFGAVRVLRWSFAENDRARAEREDEGLAKLVVRPNGRVVGASIVGAHAGELIQLWALVVARGLRVGAVAGMIAPYPTLGEAGRRAAGRFFEPTLFGPGVRRLVRALAWLG